jgi:hypothetical protein
MPRIAVGLIISFIAVPIGFALAAAGSDGANDGLTAYELTVFIHQLLFVYWLGPDIGVYVLSGKITDPQLSAEQRLAAAKTMAAIDLVPRICMSLMLTVGGILVEFVGVPHRTWEMAGIVLLGPAWLTLVLLNYLKQGTALGATLTRIDFWFRWVLLVCMLLSVSYSWSTGELDEAPWVAGKLVLFAAIILFGLFMRIQVRPLMEGIGELATAGPSDQLNEVMAGSLARTKPFVVAMWVCLVLEGLLGVWQPGSPEEPAAGAASAANATFVAAEAAPTAAPTAAPAAAPTGSSWWR